MKQRFLHCLAVCMLLAAISTSVHAVTYKITDLGVLPEGMWSSATDINDSGMVVGQSYSGSGVQAFLWDGTMHGLGLLSGATSSYIGGINNSGIVVGTSSTPSGDRAFLWDGETHDLGALIGENNSYAYDVNDSGVVVGMGNNVFLWDGKMHNLNDFIDPSTPGWTLIEARGINSSGQIVGLGSIAGGMPHAYLATPYITTPVPEPSSMVALLCGLGGLGTMLRRRNPKRI